MSESMGPKTRGDDSSLIYGPIMITDPALGCPVAVAAGRVRAVRDDDLTPRFVTGWGATFEEAAAKCRLEADETYFAQIVPDRRIIRAPASEMLGCVVEPPTLMLFSEAQYRGRLRWNRHADHHAKVPVRWQRSQPLDWIQSDPRFSTSVSWLPAALCVLGYPNTRASGLPPADSNGVATGSSVQEAAVRGFCEVVERDATAIWWYNKLALPRIDLPSLGEGLVSRYAHWLKSQGRELRLLHLTLDLPIPIVAAIAYHSDGGEVALGFAAGRSTPEAARRAVGELAECEANLALLKRKAAASGTADFSSRALQLYRWHLKATVRHPHLSGSRVVQASPDVLQLDWCSCLEIARERKLETFVIDLTVDTPPLVRVFVPGLRHTKPRFDSGRLYDVPPRLGLKSRSPQPVLDEYFPF
jgi:thiazole/oxazole-forming peptide maturase SagD family component